MAVAKGLDQLKVTLWKNYVIKKRNIKTTITEIFFPIILVAILAIVRLSVKDTLHDVRPGYPSVALPCFSKVMMDQGAIMYAPNNNVKVNQVIAFLRDQTQGSKVQWPFLGFATSEDIDEFVKTNTTDPNELPLWAGIVFNDPGALDGNNTNRNKTLTYQLRLNATALPNTQDFSVDLPRGNQVSDGASPAFQYATSGFLTLQQEIDTAIIRVLSDNVDSPAINIALQRFPTPAWSDNTFQLAVSNIISFFLVIAFAISLRFLVSNLVMEKEKKIKEGMKIMGMKHWIFWASWMITSFLTLSFSVTVVGVIFKVGKIFQHSDFLIVWIFYLLFAISTIAYACVISTLFNKARTASQIAMISFYLASIPAVILKGRKNAGLIRALLCLLSPCAFSFGTDLTSRLEADKIGLTWATFTKGSDEDLAMSTVMLWLAIDSVLYMILAWYMDNIMPGEYGSAKSKFFCFSPSYWFPSRHHNGGLLLEEVSTESSHHEACESVPAVMQDLLGVSIRQLKKEYKATPKNVLAVNGLNLDMYKDQVTVVLGHNGAGKTTSLSMLTGLVGPTSGDAWVLGKSVTHQIDEVRTNIGICPQHDILFDELTVYEHLRLFAILKGVAAHCVEQEVAKKMSEVGLVEKKHTLTSALSGGMKRKLSVALAFIGESEVVFLDEPCSGIDAYTRRLIWSLVEKNKKGKVIVLTTHSMDEADLLGDRIAIMSKGKLRCVGSSMFLKSRFGIGYNMTMVKDSGCDEQAVTGVIQEHVPDAKLLNTSGAELAYVLPLASVKKFSALFSELDEKKDVLDILSYGISVTTLEEVFLRIAQEEEDQEEPAEGFGPEALSHTDNPSGTDVANIQNSDSKLTSKTSLLAGTGVRNRTAKQQLKALFVKRAQVARRDKRGAMMQIFVPVFFLLLSAVAIKIQASAGDNQPKPLDPITIGSVGDSDTPWVIAGDWSGPAGADWMDEWKNRNPGQNITGYPSIPFMQKAILKAMVAEDAPNGGYIFDTSMSSPEYNYTQFFNPNLNHATPGYISMMNGLIIASALKDNDQEIVVINAPLPNRYGQTTQDINAQIGASIMAIYTTLAFAFIPAIVAAIVVRERETKAKHQQLVSGIKLRLYWFATWAWDFAMYLIPCIVTILIMIAFQQEAFIGARLVPIFFMLLLSGMAMLPLTYGLSFLFEKHMTAQVGLLLTFMFLGLVTITVSFVFIVLGENGSPSFTNIEKMLKYPFFLLPNYAVGKGLMSVFFEYIIAKQFDSERASVLSWDQLGAPIVFLLGETVVFWIFTAYMERKSHQAQVHDHFESSVAHEDEDVARERKRIEGEFAPRAPGSRQHGPQAAVISDDNVKIVRLRKVFPPSTKDTPPKVAVRSLSCGIPRGEVFGLLGPNGAGKTTSLSILTGEINPSAGTAYLGGFEITTQKDLIYDQLGFCPQADALIDLMTCRELLVMYSRIKGIQEEEIPSLVASKVAEVGLRPHVDKLSKDLSGGNKRKLSLAIACIGDPNILFLDEPSTGMDPMARRHMWNVISRYRHGRSVILTTHSLEEADALCTRIAIMVNGEMQCLGSAQHLKDKFGSGYLMEIAADPDRAEEVKTFISQQFPDSVLAEWHGGHMKYELPKSGMTLAAVFNLIEDNRAMIGLIDYSISQPTLEQIFIQFARQQEEVHN